MGACFSRTVSQVPTRYPLFLQEVTSKTGRTQHVGFSERCKVQSAKELRLKSIVSNWDVWKKQRVQEIQRHEAKIVRIARAL